jgi:hypothetical protein
MKQWCTIRKVDDGNYLEWNVDRSEFARSGTAFDDSGNAYDVAVEIGEPVKVWLHTNLDGNVRSSVIADVS